MNHLKCFFILLSAFAIFTTPAFAESKTSKDKDILEELQDKLKGATITELDTSDHFVREFEVLFDQPLDHFDKKNKTTFQQRIFISHYSKKAPVLFVTEGYSARHTHYELTEIMKSNQVQVEYRYFGKSIPSPKDYNYLTNDQAMEDLHRIRKLLGKIYKKDWVSTGISKGGTTCLIYKTKYPKDVKVAVPYVAPLPYNQTDKRCDQAILTNGTPECRATLEQFQHALLDNREFMLAKLDSIARVDSMTFNRMGKEEAFEYAVLEFTFSFWQWGYACDEINPDVSPDSLFKNLNRIVGFSFYSDKTCDYFEPSYYQFLKENGYYAFIHEPFKGKLTALKRYDNLPFGPQDMDLSMDHDYLKYVRVWLYHKGEKIIHIQGGNDPWGACGMPEVTGQDALHMTLKDGHHRTRIKSFSKADQQKIYNKLHTWLKIPIYPLVAKSE